jgi:predicted transcriptional regulator/transcriptional regulator with XRE-family HTH domain
LKIQTDNRALLLPEKQEGQRKFMIPLGPRLRTARKKKGITQSKLASLIGISVSYLNLIEHDKRNAGPALVSKLTRALNIDLDTLSAPQDARLIHDLENLAAESLFQGIKLERGAPKSIVANHPHWAEAIMKLYHTYQANSEAVEAMSERLARDPYMIESSHQIMNIITSIRSFSEILEEVPDLPEDIRTSMAAGLTSESRKLGSTAKSLFDFINDPGNSPRSSTPAEQVNDFLIDKHNYFEELEEASSDLRARISRSGSRISDALFDYLQETHGITVKFCSPAATTMPGTAAQYRYNKKSSELLLANTLPEPSVRFQLVQLLLELEHGDTLKKMLEGENLAQDVFAGAQRALLNYTASAFLFPYETFLQACEDTRYDIQMLRQTFGGSFEQICHRFTTLKRPGLEGVPFAFLRVDPAGNISKRFTLPNLQLPRGGGACPLLPAYRAFLRPGKIRTQIGVLPEGQKYLYVARTVSKHVGAYGEPDRTYAVMVACELHHIDKVLYGDRLAGIADEHAIPVGIHCRTCSRKACQHRAHGSILRSL